MSSLKLITGTSTKYYFFKEKILQHYGEEKPDSYIYLLPVNRAVRYFKQQLFSEVESKGVIDPQVFTFNSLVQKFFKELYPNTKIINSTIRITILNEVLASLKNELKLTNKSTDLSRSLVRKIDIVLNELKEFGYNANAKSKNEWDRITKIPDFNLILEKIYEFYNSSQFSLIDESLLLSKTVNDLNPEQFRNLFPKIENMYLNGYGIYTPPMLEFIRKIKLCCSVEVMLEFNQNNLELYQNTLNAYESLKSMADFTETIQGNSTEIEKHFYKFDSDLKDKIDLSDKITIQKAQNREQELYLIASNIKDLNLNQGIPLHRIGVTFPNLEVYFNTIKSVFNEYDIPVNISTGYPLLNSYLIKSYLQILKIILSGFSLNEIFKLLLSPFYQSKASINFSSFKKIAIKLRLTHLRGNWQQLLNNKIQQKNVYYTAGISNESFLSFKDELTNLLEIIETLNKEVPAQDFYTNYLTVLKKLGLFIGENTKNNVLSIKESEKEFRAFNKFNHLFEQLKWILENNHGNKKFSVKEYYNFMNLIFEDATYNLREWPNYGVQIMPQLEIQSAEPEYLFIGGLVEGDFPRKFSRDIFFNDEERAILGLNAKEDFLNQDRFLFFQLLSSKAKKIVLSYPQFQSESVLVPSSFLSNLEKICFVQKMEMPNAENYFSENKLIEYVGRKIHKSLDEADINYFNIWSHKNTKERSDILLEDLTTIFHKRNRSNITNFEGNLSGNLDVLKIINEYFADKSFSITALESFAFCPMQYFMQRILKLNEDEEIETTMPALERGALIHRILFKFFMQLKSQKLNSQPWNQLELLNDIATEEFNELEYQGLLWDLEKEIYFGTESQPGLWKKFLEVELNEFNHSEFKPSFFEIEFGVFNKNVKSDFKRIPFIIENKNRKISLFGKIDRIDIDNKNNAIIYDYKTGKSGFNINFNDIFEGKSLQLPIYLAAANQTFNSLNLKINTIAAGYYLVMDSINCERKTIFADVQKKPDVKVSRSGCKLPNSNLAKDEREFGLEELTQRINEFILSYTDNLYNGYFRHTKNPKDLRCSSYCSYKMTCRKDISKLISLNQKENIINE